MTTEPGTNRIVVVKIGGSVLDDNDSYGQVARFLSHRRQGCSQESLVVVVSAQKGHTDELEALARQAIIPTFLDSTWQKNASLIRIRNRAALWVCTHCGQKKSCRLSGPNGPMSQDQSAP